MDSMDVRLRNIETILQTMANSRPSPHSHVSTSTGNADDCNPLGWCAAPTESIPSLNGEHLFKIQTIDAGNFLDRAVIQGRIRGINPSIHSSIINLRGLVAREGQRPSNDCDIQAMLQKTVAQDVIGKLSIPPKELVYALLENAAGSYFFFNVLVACADRYSPVDEPSLFTYNLMHVGIEDFMPICEAFYLSPGTASMAEWALVNAGLYYLFVEQSCNKASAASLSMKCDNSASICQRNVEAAIKSCPFLLSPEVVNVQALVLLVSVPSSSSPHAGLTSRTIGTLRN